MEKKNSTHKSQMQQQDQFLRGWGWGVMTLRSNKQNVLFIYFHPFYTFFFYKSDINKRNDTRGT